jgi:hypothetical protein
MTFDDLWAIVLLQKKAQSAARDRIQALADSFLWQKPRDDRFSQALMKCGADKILVEMLKTNPGQPITIVPTGYAELEKEVLNSEVRKNDVHKP